MTEIKSKGPCADCSQPSHHQYLTSIGSPVWTDDGAVGTTHYGFLQCSDCGSIIARYSDRGRERNGPFFKRITAGMY